MTSATASLSTIEINGVVYAPVGSSSANTLPTGNRHVVVLDRGWIYAGDLSYVEEGGITWQVISNATHVFRWESIGFTGVLENPKNPKVTLKEVAYPVKVPLGSVIYTVPVPETWGK